MTRDELRKAYAEGRRDFRGVDLSNMDLRHMDLSYMDLRGADLRYTDLSYTDLSGTKLRGANLSYADLPKELTIIYGERYYIQIFKDNVRAGCQCHSASEWLAMTGDQLYEMDEEDAIAYYPELVEIIKWKCKKYI